MEIFRRVYLSKQGYKLGGIGCRSAAYDLSWDELPDEIQPMFSPNIRFVKWEDSEKMLQDEKQSLEAQSNAIQARLEALKDDVAPIDRKGKHK